ncbi:MAG: hypothetical protein ACOX14_03520 [Fermentimonas caenicola]
MPPYWLTGWAYLFYSLIILGGLFLLVRYLNHREKLKRKEEMRDFERIEGKRTIPLKDQLSLPMLPMKSELH